MITVVEAGPADRADLSLLLEDTATHYREDADGRSIAEAAEALTTPAGRAGPFCLLARDAAAPVGFAALSGLVPVFQGRWGLFLQLLYVTEAARGTGAARALMGAVARFAAARGYVRVDWQAMPQNPRATGLYASLGVPVTDRLFYRLDGKLLAEAASHWPERAP